MTEPHVDDALREVARSITDWGRSPSYHRKIIAAEKALWPTFWTKMERLLAAAGYEGAAEELISVTPDPHLAKLPKSGDWWSEPFF